MTNEERIQIDTIRLDAESVGRQILSDGRYNVATETALCHIADALKHIVQRIDQIEANNGVYRPGAFLSPKSP